ncbi:hypothetical protein ARMGADRAFT_456449 [Armillaria gallica]|uniref:Uncharacterized protein n=1 Tax=Armillaria gallica TaxID=47427 RepID=A0A2H3DJ57_ARMGA|nr:hypothetical protein ARMGADRAFT_456449 [Armillaria gallica]
MNEDTSSLASSSQPSRTTVIQPRRELVWQAAVRRVTDLRKISQEYGSFVRRDKHSRPHVRRIHAQIDDPFLHQCSAYQREDLTLTHAILDNRVVVFTVPSHDEVCVFCGPGLSPWFPPPPPLPEFPPARPGWRTGNVRPSKEKKRDSGLPPPAAPPPGPDPRAQVCDWAQWHPEPHSVPTPPAIERQFLYSGQFNLRLPSVKVYRKDSLRIMVSQPHMNCQTFL